MENKKGKRTFIALTLSFMIFNIFISLSSNSYFIGKMLKNNFFMTVELQNDIQKEKIQEFEKFLLSNENVKGVKFLSRNEAFKNLQKELEIVIPKNENPLPNSIIVYFKNEKNLQTIQELLDVNSMVREIYIDNQFLENNIKKIKVVNISIIIFLILSAAVYYQITTILRAVIIRDYIIYSIKKPNNKNVFLIAKNKNLIPFIGSSLVGGLIFSNAYIILRDNYQFLLPGLILQSFNQIFILEIFATLFALILSWKSTPKLKRDEA
ncbi:MAG: cell division protein FtsX [Cetobacterium sp.]